MKKLIIDQDFIDPYPILAEWEEHSDIHGEWFPMINYYCPESEKHKDVKVIDNVFVETNRGWFIAKYGFLQYCSWFKGHSSIPRHLLPPASPKNKLEIKIQKRENLPGLTLSCITDNNGVYGHRLMEGLYRLLACLKTDIFDDVDQILIPSKFERQIKSLPADIRERIYEKKIVEADWYNLLNCEKLVVMPHPACCMNPCLYQLSLIREMNVGTTSISKDVMFLDRKDTERRNVANMNVIYEILKGHNILVVEGAEVDNPWALFRDASCIIGVHGSNLADVIFMRQGSKVLEILPTDHRKPYHYNIANTLGLDFHFLMADSDSMRETVNGFSNAAIKINPEKFEDALKMLI